MTNTATWFRNGVLDGSSNAPTVECLIERGGKYYALSVPLSGGHSPFRGATQDEKELQRRKAFAYELLDKSIRATDWLLADMDEEGRSKNSPAPAWVLGACEGGGVMMQVELHMQVPIGWGYLVLGDKPEVYGWRKEP